MLVGERNLEKVDGWEAFADLFHELKHVLVAYFVAE